MGSELSYIISDLQQCFDGKPWYGDPIMKKLDSINWRVVNDEKYGSKTIAVLLQHIINWRIFVLKKLQGDAEYDIIIDGQNDWAPIYIKNEQEWDRLKQELRKTQDNLLSFLSKCDDALLNKIVPGKKYFFGPILQSIVQHDIYHLGQIAMLNAKHGK
ncbi:MAG: DinB family protein [Maribacter sp.]